MSEAHSSWCVTARRRARDRENLGGATRRRVLAALRAAKAPLTLAMIARLAGVSYSRAHRALEPLRALNTVAVTGAANNLRFEICEPGMGIGTGGLASASAAGACAGPPPSAARPGEAA